MINEQNKHDYMRAYVYNDLKDNERAIFEAKLVNDAEFARELKIYALLIEEYHKRQKVKFKKWSDEVSSIEPQQKTTSEDIPKANSQTKHLPLTSTSNHRLYRIAATFLLFLGILILWQLYQPAQPTVENLITQHLATQYEMLSNRLDVNPPSQADKLWSQAERAYEAEQYSKAIIHLEDLIILNSSNARSYFFTGLCYLYQDSNKSEQAIEMFQKSAQINSDYVDEANWYISLTHLKRGDKVQAITLLSKLINSSADKEFTYKYHEAKELLEVLEK